MAAEKESCSRTRLFFNRNHSFPFIFFHSPLLNGFLFLPLNPASPSLVSVGKGLWLSLCVCVCVCFFTWDGTSGQVFRLYLPNSFCLVGQWDGPTVDH